MTSQDLPIACNLTDPEFQKRRADLLEIFQGARLETIELPTGYAYRFPSGAQWIADLAQLISFERECCPFLTFNMRIESASGPMAENHRPGRNEGISPFTL